MKKRRTAPEIIGFMLGWDIADVSEMRYQPTRYNSPSIYTIGNGYYAAPSNNKAPSNMKGAWELVGEYYGRNVYFLDMNNRTS